VSNAHVSESILPEVCTLLGTRRAVVKNLASGQEDLVSNPDCLVLQFRPKFCLLFTSTRLY